MSQEIVLRGFLPAACRTRLNKACFALVAKELCRIPGMLIIDQAVNVTCFLDTFTQLVYISDKQETQTSRYNGISIEALFQKANNRYETAESQIATE